MNTIDCFLGRSCVYWQAVSAGHDVTHKLKNNQIISFQKLLLLLLLVCNHNTVIM